VTCAGVEEIEEVDGENERRDNSDFDERAKSFLDDLFGFRSRIMLGGGISKAQFGRLAFKVGEWVSKAVVSVATLAVMLDAFNGFCEVVFERWRDDAKKKGSNFFGTGLFYYGAMAVASIVGAVVRWGLNKTKADGTNVNPVFDVLVYAADVLMTPFKAVLQRGVPHELLMGVNEDGLWDGVRVVVASGVFVQFLHRHAAYYRQLSNISLGMKTLTRRGAVSLGAERAVSDMLEAVVLSKGM
jgi:hypothetical protein